LASRSDVVTHTQVVRGENKLNWLESKIVDLVGSEVSGYGVAGCYLVHAFVVDKIGARSRPWQN
jgi:hypothetical protein